MDPMALRRSTRKRKQAKVYVPSDEKVFCLCKGNNEESDIYVYCENGEEDCPYNGWFHPECTEDLKDKTEGEIKALKGWYCHECIKERH